MSATSSSVCVTAGFVIWGDLVRKPGRRENGSVKWNGEPTIFPSISAAVEAIADSVRADTYPGPLSIRRVVDESTVSTERTFTEIR
jgi:hypothetical protein